MPRLYVANCTPQSHVFSYRLLGTQRIVSRDIRAGEQEIVTPDLNREQIDNVIEQNEQYGLHPAADVNRARDYVHTLWSIDKHVTHAQMTAALERNLQLKALEGHKTRQMAASSMAEVMQRENPNIYTGMRMAVEDRGNTDVTLNEMHTHRRDGQYERGVADFEAPLAARKASRRRKVA